MKSNETEAILQRDGYEFITDWTFFSVMGLEDLVKEGSQLLKEHNNYKRIVFVPVSTARFNLWGKK